MGERNSLFFCGMLFLRSFGRNSTSHVFCGPSLSIPSIDGCALVLSSCPFGRDELTRISIER